MKQEIQIVKLGAAINSMRRDGALTIPQDDLAKQSYASGSNESREAWFELKPELYKPTTFLAEALVEKALAKRNLRQPFGLVTSDGDVVRVIDGPTPFRTLGKHMLSTLLAEQGELLEELQQRNGTALTVESLERMQELMDFSMHVVQNPYPPQTDVAAYLEGGSITAAGAMSRFLELIFEMYGGKGDKQTLVKTARNSFALAVTFANRHSARFSALFKETRIDEGDDDWHFNPEAFQLSTAKQGDDILEVKSEILQRSEGHVARIRQANPDSPYEHGCPILNSPAMKRLWSWYIDIAEQAIS